MFVSNLYQLLLAAPNLLKNSVKMLLTKNK